MLDRTTYNANHIICEELAKAGISYVLFRGEARDLKAMRARRIIMKRLRDELGLSTGIIGRLINRDSSTVKYHLTPGFAERKNARRTVKNRAKREAMQ